VLHFSLPVTDLDRSRKFYEGLLERRRTVGAHGIFADR
jgi:catechol 2,3-dioxygenase-like lactoylglutathione lyase family enzyme